MSKGEIVVQPGEPGSTNVESKGLKGGALGLVSSIVVGMASTAPAYSLAATLGLIIASGGALLSGVKAPAIVLISFIPMYLIAVAYQELNKAEADCGTTFTWASRAFGPIVGWLGGWGIIAADVIVMANLAQIAGAYSFTFVGDLGWHSVADLADSTFWVHGGRNHLDRGDDLHLLPRHRGVGTHPVRAAQHRSCRADHLVDRRAGQGLHPQRRGLFALPVAVVVLAGRLGLQHRHRARGPHHDLHLLGLGHRRRVQRGVRRPGPNPRSRRGDLHLPPTRHLRAGQRCGRRLRRCRHRRHRPRQSRQRR